FGQPRKECRSICSLSLLMILKSCYCSSVSIKKCFIRTEVISVGWQPGNGNGTGDEPGSGVPSVPGFARDGAWRDCPPSAGLAVAMESAAGPGWEWPRGAPDELLCPL